MQNLGWSSHSGSAATTCFDQRITINDANNVSAQWHWLTHYITGCVSVWSVSQSKWTPCHAQVYYVDVVQCSWLWMCKTGKKKLHTVSPALPKVLTAADYQHKPQLQLYNVSADQTWRRLREWRKTEFRLSLWRNQMLVAVWTGENIEMLTNLSLWLTGYRMPGAISTTWWWLLIVQSLE